MPSLVDRVRNALWGDGRDDASDVTPESVCPNCWGHHEYGNEVRRKMKYHRYSPDSTDGRAFIEEFVVKHISGIDLEDREDGFYCPRCKRTH